MPPQGHTVTPTELLEPEPTLPAEIWSEHGDCTRRRDPCQALLRKSSRKLTSALRTGALETAPSSWPVGAPSWRDSPRRASPARPSSAAPGAGNQIGQVFPFSGLAAHPMPVDTQGETRVGVPQLVHDRFRGPRRQPRESTRTYASAYAGSAPPEVTRGQPQ
jgi:anti-sigma factor RsiW